MSENTGLPSNLPTDHPLRLSLANEVHARPPEWLEAPTRATHMVFITSPEDKAPELEHLRLLCEQCGETAPTSETAHFAADLDSVRLKWERHGEFSSYTFFAKGLSEARFTQSAIAMLPTDWVRKIPGTTIFAAHAELISCQDREPDIDAISRDFEGNTVVGGRIGRGAGFAFADFTIHADGFSRFLVLSRTLTQRQSGRMMQRLFEIETYRMMAMLALPLAREQFKHLSVIERSLSELTDDIASRSASDDSLLQNLTNMAAEVENMLAASQFRFGACKAYHELVLRRIAELREQRLSGTQTIGEFMTRRFTPAAATCSSTAQRLNEISERVSRTSALLSTRVDIAREAQNNSLLGSMNRRAQLQLKLQRTVEILSVIPITYYLVGLVGYISRAFAALVPSVEPDFIEAAATPLAALSVILAVRRAHRKIVENPH